MNILRNRKWQVWFLVVSGIVAALSVRRGRQTKAMLRRYNETDTTATSGGPKPGDILLFYRPQRKRDQIIQFFTDSPFYHAALFAGSDRVVEARPRGVLEDGLQGRENNFVVVPAPEGQGEKALAWARTQIGDPFSERDLLMIALDRLFLYWNINYATPGKFTCAEFVTTSFDHAGVHLFPGQDRDEIAPADLATLLPSEERETLPKLRN